GIRSSINDLFRDLEMPYDLIPELAALANESGLDFMSSAFSVDDVVAIDPYVPRHKVASYEISHVRLLQSMAATGKPMIVSTGAATYYDSACAIAPARTAGSRHLTLLQCTASYPAPFDSLNLRVIPSLQERYGLP